MLRIQTPLLALFATALVAFAPACGTTDDAGLGPGKRPGQDDGLPNDDGNDDDGPGGAGSSGGGFGSDPDGFRDGGDEDTCSETTEKAERMPLDMHIMLDKSGSMRWTFHNKNDAQGGPTSPNARWGAVVGALKEFINDPSSNGVGVGLQYFPIETGGFFGGTSCEASDYATPEIPIQLLPMHRTQLIASLDANRPNGGTPTRPALQGALEYAKGWADDHPGHTVIVVLATDGEPEGCSGNNVANVSALAADYANNHGIKTFVVGIGPEVVNMDTIAAAGGTEKSFPVGGDNAAQQFIEAMNEIRGVALACEYLIPPPKDGEAIDYDKVNLRFTAGDGTTSDIPYVGDASQCGSGGWFYDDPSAPKMIHVCPETCSTFKADGEGEVNVVLGCKRRGPA